MVFSTSRFQSLSVRPPTPPKHLEPNDKEADEVLDFLNDPFGTKEPVAKVIAAKALLNTPQTSPSSESGIPSGSSTSSARKKRVNFEPQLCLNDGNGPASQSYIPLHSSPLRPLPQTRVSKPLKSILKPSDITSTPPPADEGAPAHTYKSFAAMLESIMKQLASQNRSARFDAYHSLQRTMQAYEKIPDTQALVDKMGLLTQFIERDMLAVGINGTNLDSQLIGQALKLLMALVRIQEVRPAMSDDFCAFAVDRIIQVAADASLPKVVINTHLAVLMQQNFRPRTMTPARVERILDVLDTIEERVSGLSVLAYRVRIFRKLIQQRPEIMTRHTERWFKHTVKALLSTLKDINQSALDTIISAAKVIGTDRHVTKSVLSVMNRLKSDGDTVTHGMAKELQKMFKSDHAALVPQIWSAVTSLLRGCLDKNSFPALAEWLTVFQMFFSSTNETVKLHANIALGFLVYAVDLKEDSPRSWSKMLVRVPRVQLEDQRGQWKKTERDAATSGYFALLYHSLGPVASQKQLDRYWTDFVADFWSPLVRPSSNSSSSPKHALAACRVVTALLNGTRKPWDLQRALDPRPQAMLQREDLPSLDSKWVRKSLPSILEFVETLLDITPWTTDDCKDEPAKEMWLSLLDSLNTASSQEVMASTESKDAMAHLVNFLRRVWDGHVNQLALSQQKEDSWADKFCFVLETVVQKLGASRFSDKCLTRNGHDEFEAAATPSHRARQHGPRTSPLLYFVDLWANQSEGKLSDSVRLRALRLLIEPCYKSQNTRSGGLDLLRDCAALVDASSGTPLSNSFWSDIAGLTTACIVGQPSDLKERGSRQFGKEYDIVVEILAFGFSYLSKEAQGQQLLKSFADTVRQETGEGAVVLAVIEKVSECVLKRTGEDGKLACLPFLSILVRNLPTSIARRIIEQGRQNLWPSSSNPGRNPDFDPYNHLYDAIVSVGSAGYHKLNVNEAAAISDFIAALATSIRQCPTALLAVYLRKVQDTVRLWVEDPQKKLQHKTAWINDVYTEVLHLWEEVCAAMHKLPRQDDQILLHLQPLITGGFTSRRRGIVDRSIASWNATFGKVERLRYPAQLEEALRRLQNTVNLYLPSLDEREDKNDNPSSFYDSDNNMEVFEPPIRSPRVKETPFKIIKSTRKTRSQSRSPAVPSTNKRVATGRTPKGRLRHENSQIQFEPIHSSPSNPFNQESQILTERQRDVIERQMRSSNLFADMRSTTPLPEPIASARSPLELHSDAMSADEVPAETTRTPLRKLTNLGPMDVFVGSSPTPHARDRTQEVASDRTSVATPTAVRTVQLAHDADQLGSSPPRFEKHAPSISDALNQDNMKDVFDENLDDAQPEQPSSVSFDDGTTIEDVAFPEDVRDNLLDPAEAANESSTEIDASDIPSSILDLQLTAQFDAELQAQEKNVTSAGQPQQTLQEGLEEGTSLQPNDQIIDMNTENNVEVDDTVAIDTLMSNTDTNSTSRVGDSFSSRAAEVERSQVSGLRRSGRHSSAFSPPPASAKKRKSSSGRGRGRPKSNKTQEAPEEEVSTTGLVTPGTEDIPVETATRHSQAPSGDIPTAPETTRARGVRRSASLFSQVEKQSGDVVDDTPAHKRPRRSVDKDVSEAKQSTPNVSQRSKAKRLSHVQVTPKRSSDALSSGRSSSVVAEGTIIQKAASEPAPEAPLVDEQSINVAPQLPDATPAASQAQESPSQQIPNSVATPSRSFAERVILTPRSILNQLKYLKDALFGAPQLALARQEEVEADDLLFDVRRMLHAAGQRGEQPRQ